VTTARIDGAAFVDALSERGFRFLTGVPCSIFGPLYKELEKRPDLHYLPSVREDSAVGIAVGAYMAGQRPVVMMQNSGLGYSLNAFTSLAMIYEIPLLVLVSWRGYLGNDAPEHLVIGRSMLQVLDAVGARRFVLGEREGLQDLWSAMESLERERQPVFLVVRDGVLA